MRRIFSRAAWSIVALAALCGQAAAQFDLLSQSKLSTKDVRQNYPLTAQNGPVMIRVASFIETYLTPSGGALADGRELANALAKELREVHGIEAFTCKFQAGVIAERNEEQQKEYEKQLELFEKKYKVAPRVFKLQTPPPVNWVVLAGNFPSFNDRGAKRMLDRIQSINPTCLSPEIRQLMRHSDKEENPPRPLKTAMLVPNPHPESAPAPVADNSVTERLFQMLLDLNDGDPLSVYHLKAPLTIRVALYRGVAVVDPKNVDNFFSKNKVKEDKANLQESAKRAILMTEELRKKGYEAYVFHGKFASMVMVGGYAAPNDPRVLQDLQKLSQVKIAGVKLEPKLIAAPRRPPTGGPGQLAN